MGSGGLELVVVTEGLENVWVGLKMGELFRRSTGSMVPWLVLWEKVCGGMRSMPGAGRIGIADSSSGDGR